MEVGTAQQQAAPTPLGWNSSRSRGKAMREETSDGVALLDSMEVVTTQMLCRQGGERDIAAALETDLAPTTAQGKLTTL